MWAILSYFIKLHRFCMTLSDYGGYAPNIRPLEMRYFYTNCWLTAKLLYL